MKLTTCKVGLIWCSKAVEEGALPNMRWLPHCGRRQRARLRVRFELLEKLYASDWKSVFKRSQMTGTEEPSKE